MLSNTQAFTLLSFLIGASVVKAHGHVASWTISGETFAGFNPSNAAEYGSTAERPTDNSDQGFADYTSAIVACGGLSAGSGLETWDVNAGDSVTAHWNTWPDSHKGPVTEYMAACPSTGCDGVDAASLQWFKIEEVSFDGTKWPSDTIVSTLEWTFTIPSDLAAGPYLVRHDIIAMHSTGAPQVYPVCFQANLISSGSVVPTDTVTFPAAYGLNDDFKTWNLYGGDQSLFVPPGPAVYSGGSSGTTPTASASSSAPAETSAAETSAADTSAPAETSAAATPTTYDAASVPAETEAPATSNVASAPASSSTSAASPVDTEYPSESAPATSAAETSAAATSATSAAPALTTSDATGNAEMGGPVPPVTQAGNRYVTLGGSYFDEQSAINAACMEQMNRCKRWANGLTNSEVSAALTACDGQVTTCQASGASAKRAIVMNRYAKRTFF
ncbi:hypothetical protein I302_107960 [Kwoniella bestiolae CBS 10118]|uniref:lytic cellulose monooxygenase (C4-dehydrogenating) n=1 Tax=Kwoniella bestiolae CBS 10118 TaxID=1296100 RepID=A0A1B9FX24_9TREE|nr:hypothetical protein I302_07676 [Kwoniella bestiolae CBS 10118]OCF23322.1 hypothetical protein I302_07676 [Kwoniella bestiolae CBS 10118]